MRPSKRTSIAVVGVVCVFAVLLLTGCPPVVSPRVTLLDAGEQQIGVSIALDVGTTLSLLAQSTSAEDSFVWSSSAPDVAAVDASGLVTAIVPGTATITATGTVSLASASVEVTVQPVSPGEGEGEGEGECQDELAQMIPFSGRFGYGLTGPFGFVGSLTKQALTDPAWTLEGEFTFPTAGYVVDDPVVQVMESYPEQVRVMIRVTRPSPDEMVAQVITHASVTAEIPASNRATFAIHVLTCGRPSPGEGEGEGECEPAGEASWVPGAHAPSGWTIRPGDPTQADVIHFSGPSAVYQNLCRALVAVGEPRVCIDRSSHRIRLDFLPVYTFVRCNDAREPVCGIEGSFGPLEKGEWIFYGQCPNDRALNFNISFHVAPAEPGLDEHVKPISDDMDGDFLTDGEEEGLQRNLDDPDENRNGVPDGVELARDLFMRVDRLPVCPEFLPADGSAVPPLPQICRMLALTDCAETCSVCGEPYNCGEVVITYPAGPAGSGASGEFRLSFAALHYMQHGSFSYPWREGSYAGRVDVVALAHILNPPPPFEVHWVPGETCPPAWTIEPGHPAPGDVVRFSGPTAVYSNACVALTQVGPPRIVIDVEARTAELAFGPPPMMPCLALWDPVCGLEGSFGPLPEGDWVFLGQNPADVLISFKIAFHVGPPGPGLDPHVKAIPDDSDGDFLTDREEHVLQRDPQNADENGNRIPDGVDLARDLFVRVDHLPECGVDPATGVSDPAVNGQPPVPGPCKTIFMVRCTEPCAVCGERYNCGHIEIANPAAQAAGEPPFALPFAALHYMQHGSLSFRWNGRAYEERVDIPRLLRALEPQPRPETVNLCEYLPLEIGNSWEYKPWNSPLTVLYPLRVTDHIVRQDLDVWALSNDAYLGYANGFLNAFLAETGPAADPPRLQPPIPLFPEQVPINVPLDLPVLGKTVAHRGPLAVLFERFTDLTIGDFPLGDRPDAIAFVTPDAAGVVGPVIIFARDLGLVYLRCPDLHIPAFIPPAGNGLVLNSAAIQGNESCPGPPPIGWIPDGQCPAEWAVDPQRATSGDRIHFSGPTGVFGNDCEAVAALGEPHLVIDPAQHTVELRFEPLPEPVFCPEVFAPVCGLQGSFGPLPPGDWVFFVPSAGITLSFIVREPAGLDPHLAPVPDDSDGDFLSDGEERQLERDPGNPDEDRNEIPDGVDLARRLARQIRELPWFDAAGDPQFGLNPPELEQQFPKDRPYVIRFDYLVDCVWECPVCHEATAIGHLQIVNPAIHASWREGFRMPLGAWHFLEHTSFTFRGAGCGSSGEDRIDVVGLVNVLAAGPVNRVEVQWIPGEIGPKEWTVEILPLGMPLNGIRIAGPTPVFGNACEGEIALGGRPLIVMDASIHALTLVVEGPPPGGCYEVYDPVCGLEAQVIGIANGVWTFSAPMLNPPIQLTFTIGAEPGGK